MPFPMKIQPIDSTTADGPVRTDPTKSVVKSRFKRLFERQFPNVLRNSSTEKYGEQYNKETGSEFEPSSVCLAKMVQNFIEESNEKQMIAKCGRNRCNCFNGNCNDSSDDELDFFGGFSDSVPHVCSGESCDSLKSLITPSSVTEKNLLVDTTKIVESNKNWKRKDDCKKVVSEGLVSLGYDASICKSRWAKSPSFPAGEYEYIDVVVDGERVLIDIDFRSEFEIARSTGTYKTILQAIPTIFVGKSDRLQQIVTIVSEAAKQSLKKKGMHFPPWRKAEYMRAKWLSTYTRTSPNPATSPLPASPPISNKPTETKTCSSSNFSTEFELIFEEKTTPWPFSVVESDSGESLSVQEEKKISVVVSPWQPPAIKARSCERGSKIVTGLASILKDKP